MRSVRASFRSASFGSRSLPLWRALRRLAQCEVAPRSSSGMRIPSRKAPCTARVPTSSREPLAAAFGGLARVALR
eukprot:7049129-Prymnesium_polylepis.1